MSEKLLKMSVKLMLFIVFFGIAIQIFGNKTRSVMNIAGINMNSYVQQASSEFSLSSDSLNLNSSTSNIKRYISNNLNAINQMFTNGIW